MIGGVATVDAENDNQKDRITLISYNSYKKQLPQGVLGVLLCTESVAIRILLHYCVVSERER